MAFDRETFGPWLQRERERRHITLDEIADRTKISRSLFVKLERGDLAGWPSGIFRRAFFREYAGAIGLDAPALLDEFLALYPDPAADAPPASPPDAAARGGDLRLTLAAGPAPRLSRRRIRRALIDSAVIVGGSTVVAAAVGHVAVVLAVFAIVYHAVGLIYAGWTPGAMVAPRRRPEPRVPAEPPRPARVRPETRRPEPMRRPAARARRRSGERGTHVVN